MIDQPLPPPPPPISRGRRYQAYIKPFVIGFLVLASLIPLQGIRGLVLERQQISHDVAQEIAASWGGEQRVAGPVLVLPVSPRRDVGHGTYDGIAPERKPAPGRANKFIVVLPETLMVNGTMLPQTRQRGIYETQLYTQSMTLSGKFARPDLAALGVAAENVNWDDARILLYVSDIGGIIDAPTLDWNGDTSELRATGEKKKVAGTTVPLAGIDDASWPTAYSLKLSINGSRSIGVSPIADKTRVEIASPWQHPSFLGSHLPIESEIDEDGFWAKWELSHFAHLRPSSWLSFVETPSWLTEHAASDAVLIRLVTPVDHYLMSERSVKYGLLFVILVSCVLFVFETLADIRIHPVQYTMVAAALCLFFLLLVSLSEIIGFAGGYLIASTMTTALLAFYIATIARSFKRGGVLAGLLGAVYGYMFLTLVSEDHALLLGSLLLFIALGLTMIAHPAARLVRLGRASAGLYVGTSATALIAITSPERASAATPIAVQAGNGSGT